jgi:ADP-heptose:LPS heptosyltransferase
MKRLWNSYSKKMPDILIIRNDKLGDFMLAWPAFSLIKQQYPDATITALIPAYTQPMAEFCPWIDKVIIDDQHTSVFADAVHLSRKIREHRFDASISLFSEMRTALALWLARVPVRIGPATKLAQAFLNRRLHQKRSQSDKPEYEYNADLVRYYISLKGDTPARMQSPPFLQFAQEEIRRTKHDYLQEHDIDNDCRLVFVHAGSGGSAINLSIQQFAELIQRIDRAGHIHFVITAGPGELKTASALAALIKDINHSIYHSTRGLVEFSRIISICDLFISGSTGPLHIAGALNVATAAFYPARQSATPLRWQTLNEQDRRIAFSPENFTGDSDMETIDIASCADRVIKLLER